MSNILREDWIEVISGEILDIRDGTHDTPKYVSEQAYPLVTSKNLKNGVIDFSNIKYISEKDFNEINKRSKVDIGDVLFAMIGTIGNPVLVKIEPNYSIKNIGLFKNRLKIIKSELLKYYLDSLNFYSQLEERQFLKGTTQKFIPLGHLRNISVPLAPLPIQRAIVSKIEALFSDLDNGIANLKKAQAQLKIYRQAVLKKAFEGELTAEWRVKNKVVHNWENTKTGDIMQNINSGSTPKAEFLSTNGEIQFLKVYNLNFDGTLNPKKDPAYTTYNIHLSTNKRAICIAGDVLINIVGPPLGKVSMIPLNSKLEFNINQAIVRFRPNEKIDSKFLSFFLQNPETILWLESTSNTTAGQHNVKVTTCREIPINLPTIPEQIQIVAEIERRLSVCDKMEESLKESIAKAEALRQSILKKAFEGKLLSQAEIAQCKAEADYEPASELLKKIKAEKLAKQKKK